VRLCRIRSLKICSFISGQAGPLPSGCGAGWIVVPAESCWRTDRFYLSRESKSDPVGAMLPKFIFVTSPSTWTVPFLELRTILLRENVNVVPPVGRKGIVVRILAGATNFTLLSKPSKPDLATTYH
jgi:hypothetical protein